MCDENNTFRVLYKFPYPTDVYGVSELVPFKALNSLRQRHNQIFDELPTYNHIREYISDLESNAYENGNWCGLIEDEEITIKDEIFGKKNEERWIENPDHFHFREIVSEDCLPFKFTGLINHDYVFDPSINTDFVLDFLGSYCPEHNSISLDYKKIKLYLAEINQENNSNYTEYQLFYIVLMHQYGHYLAYNTSITLGDLDRIQVNNALFQEVFAQLVCETLLRNSNSSEIIHLFKIIQKTQPALYHHYQNESFSFLLDNPKYLPYFLYSIRKVFSNNNEMSIDQILDCAPQNDFEIENYNHEILNEIQLNLSNAGVFDDSPSRGVILNPSLFVGYFYCCSHEDFNYSEFG